MTVLFADAKGSMELVADLDSEEAGELLERVADESEAMGVVFDQTVA